MDGRRVDKMAKITLTDLKRNGETFCELMKAGLLFGPKAS